MNITKDTFNDIREEVAAVITAESTLFKAVYGFPQAKLAGYPAIIVMPSENLSDYSSTSDNRLAFAFQLIMYYPIPNQTAYEKAEIAIGECVADLLRIFSTKSPRPLTTCDWVEPAPSVWGETAVSDQPYRTATMTLRCIKYVEVN